LSQHGGNEAAIRKIFDEYHGRMIKTARAILNDYDLAEDAVSESLVKISRRLAFLENLPIYQQRAYIAQIVKSTAIDFLRKCGEDKSTVVASDDFFETIPDGSEDILEHLVRKEEGLVIKQAIQSLPDVLREAIYHFYIHEHSHEEISQLFNISVAASKMRLHRARKELEKILTGGRE